MVANIAAGPADTAAIVRGAAIRNGLAADFTPNARYRDPRGPCAARDDGKPKPLSTISEPITDQRAERHVIKADIVG